MGFLKKMKAKLEDLNGFLEENKSKIGGFPPIRRRMDESMLEVYNPKTIFVTIVVRWHLALVQFP